jgi:hypothetical protein
LLKFLGGNDYNRVFALPRNPLRALRPRFTEKLTEPGFGSLQLPVFTSRGNGSGFFSYPDQSD